MRIVQVIDSNGLYGAEVVLLNLMEYQRRVGHHPVLLSLGSLLEKDKAIEVEAKKHGIDVVTLRLESMIQGNEASELTRIINDYRADIVHSHGYKGDILLGLFARRRLKVPVLTTLHGWTSTKLASKMTIYKLLDVLAIKCLDGVVSVSSTICSDPMLQLFGIHPQVINNGIPELNFQTGDIKELCPKMPTPAADGPNIISIGRLSSEKGFDVLLRAVQKLISCGMNLNLVIVGEGEERLNLLQMVRDMDIADRVSLPGWLDRAFRFLPCFDVFVISSYTEGLPICLLEAMQAGVPIVATKVGEIPRVLENGALGYLVPTGDPEALATAISTVHKDSEKSNRTAVLAQERALQSYTLETMAKSYLDVYSRIINKKKRSGIHPGI